MAWRQRVSLPSRQGKDVFDAFDSMGSFEKNQAQITPPKLSVAIRRRYLKRSWSGKLVCRKLLR